MLVAECGATPSWKPKERKLKKRHAVQALVEGRFGELMSTSEPCHRSNVSRRESWQLRQTLKSRRSFVAVVLFSSRKAAVKWPDKPRTWYRKNIAVMASLGLEAVLVLSVVGLVAGGCVCRRLAAGSGGGVIGVMILVRLSMMNGLGVWPLQAI